MSLPTETIGLNNITGPETRIFGAENLTHPTTKH